jgi:hypothetical protein
MNVIDETSIRLRVMADLETGRDQLEPHQVITPRKVQTMYRLSQARYFAAKLKQELLK